LITAKLKNLRRGLRSWQATIKTLKDAISNTRIVLFMLEVFAEFRDLSVPEWNFQRILEKHLISLLEK